MLERCLLTDINEIKTVRIGNYFYSSNGAGEVFINVADNLIKLEEIRGRVEVFVPGYGNRLIPKENLIQVCWKPVFEDDLYHYLVERPVHFEDTNTSNYSPKNLTWGFSSGSLDNKFWRIPGFSRFLFNENLEIVDRVTGLKRKMYINNGYYQITLNPDYDKRISFDATFHRVLAMAFIPFYRSITRLDVNHKDGNKLNNAISNLEWCTRRENNLHAVYTGLKRDNDCLLVTDINTGEKMEFISQGECSRVLGIDKKLLSWRLNNGQKQVYDGYKFEFIKRNKLRVKHETSPHLTIIKNVSTNEIIEFKSMRLASEYIAVPYANVKKKKNAT